MSLLLTAERLWDGEAMHDGAQAVLVEHDRVAYAGPAAGLPPLPPDVARYDLGDATLMPGMIDVHAHVTFGTGARTYEEVMEGDSDVLMMLRGVHNLQRHLAAGVTTVRDCGARGRTAIELALAANAGAFPAPRLLASGPPITPTRGHFWWCGGEADGIDQIREAAKRRFAEGADFLKIMASGGGTRGTDASQVTYSAEEIAAATSVAREIGKLTTAHCLASGAIAAAVLGGIHQIEHINFIEPDGSRR
jgi:imidazolonepropionase-like amidohydrolase